MSGIESNKIIKRIQELLSERNWSIYRLAKEAGVPYSSLNNIFVRNNCPSFSTLERICAGFRISIAEFFTDNTKSPVDSVLTSREKDIILSYRSLNPEDKRLFQAYLDGLSRRLHY